MIYLIYFGGRGEMIIYEEAFGMEKLKKLVVDLGLHKKGWGHILVMGQDHM